MKTPYTNKQKDTKILSDSKEEFADDNVIKKDAFSKYFNEKLNELNEKFEIALSKKDIAKKLDISYEQFRKIINREKPAKKRDCIIAISALIGLDPDDTNLALKYNGRMQELEAWNGRDEIIMMILEEHRKHCYDKDELDYNPDILDEINKELSEKYYSPLDIISHRKKSGANDNNPEGNAKTDYPYKLIKKGVLTYGNLKCESKTWLKKLGDKSNNNHDFDNWDWHWANYNPTSVTAYMEFDDKGDKIKIKTRARGTYYYDHENYYCIRKGSTKYYDNIEDTGEFKQCFSELRKMAYKELNKSDNYYNDTKNFITRTGFRVIDSDLHIFAETFNFDNPLINEYYLLDYCKGSYTMTVSDKSRFLKMLLPEEVYTKKYGNLRCKTLAEYDPDTNTCSVSDNNIYAGNDFIFAPDSYNFNLANNWRRNYFNDLKKEVDSYISDIKKSHDLRVKYSHSYYEKVSNDPEFYRADIIHYKAEDAFKLIIKPDNLLICAYLDTQNEINNAPDITSESEFYKIYGIIKHAYTVVRKFEGLDVADDIFKDLSEDDRFYIHDVALNFLYSKIKKYLDTTNYKPDFEQDFLDTYEKIKEPVSKGFINFKQVVLAYYKERIKRGCKYMDLFYDEVGDINLWQQIDNNQHKKQEKEYKSKYNTPLKELVHDKELYDEITNNKFLCTAAKIGNPKPVFTLSDGKQVELTAEDLSEGYRLNLFTIEEIGQTILKHGSLNPKNLL